MSSPKDATKKPTDEARSSTTRKPQKKFKSPKNEQLIPKFKNKKPTSSSTSTADGRVVKKQQPKFQSSGGRVPSSGTRNKFSRPQKTNEILKKGTENEIAEAEAEKDPFPGDAPVPQSRLLKHRRGKAEGFRDGVIFLSNRINLIKKDKVVKYSANLAARSEILLPEETGFLEPAKGDSTAEITQVEIRSSVDITSATKQFDLSLQFGPYAINYLRNGRKMLIGGRMGHVAAFDWVTKRLTCEMNVMESVHDVAWLHNETLFAVAQKEWTYIYDNQGIEVHCIKKLKNVLRMEFLPYHFILATANEMGTLAWLDVSMGKMVQQTHTRLGRLDVMCQNPRNAVLCCGHSKGTVSMWTPNFTSPVVKMLCHTQPIRAIAIDPSGVYMATSSTDSSMKIWDLRTYNCLQSYKLGSGASNMAFSQRGLLAVSLGNIVEVYKDVCTETVRRPYLKHFVGNSISGLKFCPYEDVLGVGHTRGMCSMLVPGAGEPNFDALECNPFQTKSQRREAEVKSLLEKIQPEFITLDPFELGEVNRQSVLEKFEEKTRYMFLKPPKIEVEPRKNAKTVNQFRIKQRLQLEERKKRAAASNEKTEESVKKDYADSTRRATAPNVLDRFKPKLKKKKINK